MKKIKAIYPLADSLFWMLIMLVPLIAFIVFKQDFSANLQMFGINDSNIIYNTLDDLFGSSGIFPLFSANSPYLLYFTYLIVIELMHLFVDFLVFIPRLAHKWFDSFTRTEDVL